MNLTIKLRAAIMGLSMAAIAWHALWHAFSMAHASIETQNFCTAVQLMLRTLEMPQGELQQLLQAGIAALEGDACAGTPNVLSALAYARAILVECDAPANVALVEAVR